MKILFFGQLRENLNMAELVIDTCPDSVAQLRSLLAQKSPVWQQLLNNQNVLVAVNQTLTDDNKTLSVEDEIAFFPPVTGG
ncbi:molybdopterin converting factor subunit 1 [Aliiglaciecola sp. LCG003]|uniref:molybdopterin converting factor subunit 1 n=1 Tax=Aliiglaciecola sp. LCG003 TaxID=3053655 RepID=UPI00257236AE|nr:molybdopterin converting factor subunit 1 [Aliiglaciecola sp. LCG003]WJG11129.1 molybdopterin converting factor subunit 1 [Aliiglaciecola sp. LCG003]